MSFLRSNAFSFPALAAVGVSLGALAMAMPAYAQSYTYITNFAKTNNIYTNLNQEFPHTGTGTPGSGFGTANASYLFNPSSYTSADYIAGSNLANNGVNFNLTSDASGRDFAELNGGVTLTLSPNVSNATSVYLLTGAYNGQSYNVTFTGTGGATETFNNIALPDFNGGGPINSTGMDTLNQTAYKNQTVLQVHDTGAGGTGNSSNGSYNYYDLVEQTFTLNSGFRGQSLTSVNITSNGYETLVLGATVASSAAPEPGSIALLALAGLPVVGMIARCRRKAA